MSGRHRARPAGRARGPGRQWLAPTAVLAGASVTAWLRLTAVTRGTIWAEDGKYLNDALVRRGLGDLLRPNGGYLQLVPRVVAALVLALAPVTQFALALTAAACLTAGVCAAVVYVCSSAVTSSTLARAGFASVTVLAPMLPVEVLGNMANIHWFFLWAAPWLLLYSPRTRAGAAALGAFALVGALSEIQVLVALPLVLVDRRNRLKWVVAGGLALGGAAQVATTLLNPRGRFAAPAPSVSDIARS